MDKRPRHYAAEIISEPSREKRKEMLGKVPEIFRGWVRDIVVSTFEIRLKQRKNR